MSSDRLSVQVGPLRLKNPVMPASGTFSPDLAEWIDFDQLGALVTKSVTWHPRAGNPGPRCIETPAGMLNAVGIQNKGVENFIIDQLPVYRRWKTPLVVSISGESPEGYARLAHRLTVPGVQTIEVNISCPNLEVGGWSPAMEADGTYRTIRAVREATDLPIWAKLTPNTGDMVSVARAAQEAGADALVVANTLIGMAIDPHTKRPKLGNVTGGLSGPAVKPIVLRMVYQIYPHVNIPIIGCGGISRADDVLEYLLAGARAVQVGTYNFVNPRGMTEIIRDLDEYVEREGLKSITEIVGQANKGRIFSASCSCSRSSES
ncbi:dihydroorotate dehydrogenase [Kyrpidia spormannii]|uniref:Dihydroorotate dehydrogenase n=1 Tax=Kyrpidia spormannii TaxID=2055160 RepID=A0A2K8N700_9BACL|nr:dihydroorotate dehydrogenase [Kyrpidia spormannii]ATY85141.1 dihydroorotate dehydrogenase [Kyrpidia spormannii]